MDSADGIELRRPQGVETLMHLFADCTTLLKHFLPTEDGWLKDDGRMPLLWVKVLIEVVKNRQDEYATTMNQDRVLLKSRRETLLRDIPLPASRRAEGAEKEALERRLDRHFTLKRKIMATEVRIGEKEILQDALDWLENFQSTDQIRPRKRQRLE